MSEQHIMTNIDEIRAYMFSGNAKFTIRSVETGQRFTYRLRSKDVEDGPTFMDVLTGSDNEHDYTWIGMIWNPTDMIPRYTHGKKSEIEYGAKSVTVARWLINRLGRAADLDPSRIEFWHSGECGRCGRELTDPESIRTGLGPICRTKAA